MTLALIPIIDPLTKILNTQFINKQNNNENWFQSTDLDKTYGP